MKTLFRPSILTLLAVLACTANAKVQSITPIEAEGLLRNNFAVLVDVREANEVRNGMAAPAKWFPVGKIESDATEWRDFLSKIPKDKMIIFYCRSGRRSGIAAEKTAAKGYKTANMGGFEAWQKAGLPTRKAE